MTQLLSDEEIMEISGEGTSIYSGDIRFARAIEAAVLAKLKQQEPVAWLYKSPMPDGSVFIGASVERLQIGVGVTPDSTEQPLYAHPMPPDDVIRDAERYRWLREQTKPEDFYSGAPAWEVSYQANGMGQIMRNEILDAAIDRAMKEQA